MSTWGLTFALPSSCVAARIVGLGAAAAAAVCGVIGFCGVIAFCRPPKLVAPEFVALELAFVAEFEADGKMRFGPPMVSKLILLIFCTIFCMFAIFSGVPTYTRIVGPQKVGQKLSPVCWGM